VSDYRYEETVNSLCPMTMFFAFASLLFWLPFIFEGRWIDFSTFWLFLCTAVLSSVIAAVSGVLWALVELRQCRRHADDRGRRRQGV